MLSGQSFGQNSFQDVGSVGRPLIQVVASTTTISVTSKIIRFTGTTAVQTLTPPNQYFNGPIYILNTDSSVNTLGVSGNVALAVTVTRYKIFTLIYDPSTSKWYPSSGS